MPAVAPAGGGRLVGFRSGEGYPVRVRPAAASSAGNRLMAAGGAAQQVENGMEGIPRGCERRAGKGPAGVEKLHGRNHV